MKDVEIHLDDRPGALAAMAKALGAAGISIEGGGVWRVDGHAVAHFLFDAAAPVRDTLQAHGIRVAAERPAVLLRLDQETPGQLGLLTGLLGDAGIDIAVQYSDHHGQLVLVVDDLAGARAIADAWMQARDGRSDGRCR
ncbi:ACT domain-containing protein [Xanthomonas sp. A2111]|uniref:ACT domain-containing protein n=1 Tax=Xanthomonas hawaiiensis TaxID=3003247 RepID=A0ABU2IBC2_9XANT|nr:MULTISPECIES: ACT domain-containing protein [unclassified Xanthomonas]MBO9827193.1 ACT domain-containing protein [Xanthomonas sp. A2111]MBO9874011.1 ACT domain-containing protein [Xanthomonas sp. D-93]MDS9994717.1 ACT domain-containing protein [Xanthomonas sp. A2111]WNH46397.1 ACT domain-containing protein [Xanthomonas sp. A6251]